MRGLRTHSIGLRRALAGAAAIFIISAVVAPGLARAEAPFYFDPLGSKAVYDPEFYPLNRSAGLLSVMAQAWSSPANGDPRQNLADQEYSGQYRLQWIASLDPRYSLLVELKGSTRDNVIGDDYFLRSEFMYQGLELPMFLYGGLRLPEEGDYLVYGGIESMSYRLDDLLRNTEIDLPIAFRGFAEWRHVIDGDGEPVLRLQALAHTLPELGVQGLLLASGMDMFFSEGQDPRWMLQGHLEYTIPGGMIRWSVLTGYAIDLAEDGEQRLSVGARAELF